MPKKKGEIVVSNNTKVQNDGMGGKNGGAPQNWKGPGVNLTCLLEIIEKGKLNRTMLKNKKNAAKKMRWGKKGERSGGKNNSSIHL